MSAIPRAKHALLVAATVLGLVACAFGYAGAAWAHAARIAGDPAENAQLAQQPARVTATFSEPMQSQFAAMTVIGPDGAQWSDGGPAVDGALISVAVRPGGPAGSYAVNYRATSADGHVVTGSWSYQLLTAGKIHDVDGCACGTRGHLGCAFRRRHLGRAACVAVRRGCHGDRGGCRGVGGPAQVVTHGRAVAGAAFVTVAACVMAWALAYPASPFGGSVARAVADAAAVVTVGVAVAPALDGPRYRAELIRRATTPLVTASAVWLVAELVRLVLAGADAAGTPVTRLGLRTAWEFSVQTAAGRAGLLAVAAAAVVCAVASWAPRTGPAGIVAAGFAGIGIVGHPLIGHLSDSSLGGIAIAAHALAAALWCGVLAGLVLTVDHRGQWARVLPAFSQLSLVCVAVLLRRRRRRRIGAAGIACRVVRHGLRQGVVRQGGADRCAHGAGLAEPRDLAARCTNAPQHGGRVTHSGVHRTGVDGRRAGRGGDVVGHRLTRQKSVDQRPGMMVATAGCRHSKEQRDGRPAGSARRKSRYRNTAGGAATPPAPPAQKAVAKKAAPAKKAPAKKAPAKKATAKGTREKGTGEEGTGGREAPRLQRPPLRPRRRLPKRLPPKQSQQSQPPSPPCRVRRLHCPPVLIRRGCRSSRHWSPAFWRSWWCCSPPVAAAATEPSPRAEIMA